MNVEGAIAVAALQHVAIRLAATLAPATMGTRELATRAQVSKYLATLCTKIGYCEFQSGWSLSMGPNPLIPQCELLGILYLAN